MWDLVREAIAAGAVFQLESPPRWEYRAFEVDEAYGVIRQQLTSRGPAEAFELLISYPPETPEESFLATELPRFLDWAGVPVPGKAP
jgi:hypothetical protein